MRIGMIADDLTGANDSGVQLSQYGLKTEVRFNLANDNTSTLGSIVLDTDSRSLEKTDAYHRVRKAASFLKRNNFNIIYKKVDSTLRGNLGAEIDAIYDEFKPDFVIIAPGYPKNGRKIVDGHLYLNGLLINQTEIAKDPTSPVYQSYIPHIIQQQSKRDIGVFNREQIRAGYKVIKKKMDTFYKKGIPFLLFDSETEKDLLTIATSVYQSNYNVIWLGSAGLANYLPDVYNISGKKTSLNIKRENKPILLVVGSVSSVTRKQLRYLLNFENVVGVELNSLEVIKRPEEEIESALKKVTEVYRKNKHIAIFPTGSQKAVKETQLLGGKMGFSKKDVSNKIARNLGVLTNKILNKLSFQGLILTGGDTAKQVCMNIGADGIELIDEIETGVPIGKLIGRHPLYVVTKAGAFGKEDTFIQSMKFLQGVENVETDHRNYDG